MFAQCLRASKPQVETHLAAPFCRNRLPSSAAHLAPFSQLAHPIPALSAVAFRQQQGILARVRSLRAVTSLSTKPNHEKTVAAPSLAAPEKQTSLIAVLTFEKSPASVGFDGWNGYEEFIHPDATLPCTRSVTFESAFDHIVEDTIQVRGSLPGAQRCVDLAKLKLHGIRKARKEETTMKATMLLRNDLTGTFTVRFTPEDGSGRDAEVAVEFSAGEILRCGGGSGNALASVETGSFMVLKGCCEDAWAQP